MDGMGPMDLLSYQQYLQQYVSQAIHNTDGSNRQISEYLSEIQIKGFLVRHRTEKERALADARKAFDEHRHWPLEIVLSHLGVKPDDQ